MECVLATGCKLAVHTMLHCHTFVGWLLFYGNLESYPTSRSFCMVNSNHFIKLRVYRNRSENRTGGLFLSMCMCMPICCKFGFTEWSQAWKWVDIQMYAHVNSISHLRISSPPLVQRPLLTALFSVAVGTMKIQNKRLMWLDSVPAHRVVVYICQCTGKLEPPLFMSGDTTARELRKILLNRTCLYTILSRVSAHLGVGAICMVHVYNYTQIASLL